MLTVVCSVTQLCLTLCDPMDCTPPGSSVHGILQARILVWVAISSSNIDSYIFFYESELFQSLIMFWYNLLSRRNDKSKPWGWRQNWRLHDFLSSKDHFIVFKHEGRGGFFSFFCPYGKIIFIIIFSFIFISWKLITSQHFSGFCHTLTWISHGFTCIPHPDSPSLLPLHPIPLGLPSAPGPGTWLMHPTWAGDLFHYR